MEKKRFIFDLDQTLMCADYSDEKKYFESIFTDPLNFTSNVAEYLYEYERIYPKYEINTLSKFLSHKTGLSFNNDIIRGWIDSFGKCKNKIEDGVIDTLEYLKSKDYSLAVLTNWFYDSQISRIRNMGLDIYFDAVYAGDMCLKPRRDAYILSIDRFKKDESIFIGDNLEKDYIGPRSYGFDSILYDKNEKENNNFVKVKKINEIINKY